MQDTTRATIAANGGSAVFPSGGNAPATLTTKVTNAPAGFDIAPGATLSGTYNNSNGNLTKTSDSVTTPVITAQAAQDDYNQKFASFLKLQSDIQNQTTRMAQAQAQAAADKAQSDLQTAQLKLQQQGVSLKKAEIDAKNYALGITNTPNNSTPQANVTQDQNSPNTAVNNGLGANPNTTQNPAPQGSPAPQGGQSPADTANAGLTAAAGQKMDAMGQVTDARDQLTQQTNQLLTNLMNGTIPLSAPQQALVTSLQNQLAQNEQEQQVANASLVGATQQAAFRAGGEYTPEQMAGQIHNAVSIGVSKIQALDNSASKTIADLEISYQKDNFGLINQQYDNLSKALDGKAAAIKDTYDTVTKTLQDQRDFAQTQKEFDQKNTQFQQQQDLAIKKFQLDVGNSAIDNQVKQANSTADIALKRAQIAKIYADQSAEDLSSTQSWVKNIQSGTAKLSDVPKNLKNAVSVGLANGTPQGASALLKTTQQSIKDLNDMVDKNQGFTGAVGAKGVSSLFGLKGNIPFTGSKDPFAGSQAANFDAKLKQVTNDVVLPNLTILHGLGRVTDREFQSLQSSITSLSPSLSEGEFRKELKTITDTINAKVTENEPVNQLKTYYTASPENASKIDTLRQANPTLTPDQILQLVQ